MMSYWHPLGHRGMIFGVYSHGSLLQLLQSSSSEYSRLRDEFADAPLFVHGIQVCRIIPFWLHVLAEFGAVPGLLFQLGILLKSQHH